jgi:hypothetical protein
MSRECGDFTKLIDQLHSVQVFTWESDSHTANQQIPFL